MSRYLNASDYRPEEDYLGTLPIGPGNPLVVVGPSGEHIEGKFVRIVHLNDADYVLYSTLGQVAGIKGVVLRHAHVENVIFFEEKLVRETVYDPTFPSPYTTRVRRRVQYD